MRTPPWAFGSRRLAGAAALTLGLAVTVTGPAGRASAAIKPPCCRVLARPAAVGWGGNLDGELGDGQSSQVAVPNWVAVAGLPSGVLQVSGGFDDSLALTSDGRVWAWGATNLAPQNEQASVSDVPVLVPGLAGVTQVVAGQDMGEALRSDGTVWAWGDNYFGELGTGSDAPSYAPVQVRGLTGVTQIVAAGDWSLALRSDGTVWSWGSNAQGQLGDGTKVQSSVPVQIKGLSRVTRIAAGGATGLAVAAVVTRGIATTLSAVYAWGEGGLAGNGTGQDQTVPVRVAGLNVPSVAGISVGDDFAMVLGTDGAVWGWGSNDAGQLGNGTTTGITPNPAPVQVSGLSGATQIAAGSYYALAVRQPPLVALP